RRRVAGRLARVHDHGGRGGTPLRHAAPQRIRAAPGAPGTRIGPEMVAGRPLDRVRAGSQSVWRCVHRQSGWIGGAPVDDSGGMAGLAAGRTTRRVPDAAIGRDTGAEERLARLVDAAGAAVGSLPRRELPGRCLPRWIVVDV